MQTYLPFPNFVQSAEALDNTRLRHQRTHALNILLTLSGRMDGWNDHPVVHMWAGYEQTLILYSVAICREHIARGNIDRTFTRIMDLASSFSNVVRTPWWMGHPDFHLSHQRMLMAKNPLHYDRRFPIGMAVEPEYWWPTSHPDAVPAGETVPTRFGLADPYYIDRLRNPTVENVGKRRRYRPSNGQAPVRPGIIPIPTVSSQIASSWATLTWETMDEVVRGATLTHHSTADTAASTE